MAKDIETILLFSSPEQSFVSSSAIREMVKYGQDISLFVTKEVELACKKIFKEN